MTYRLGVCGQWSVNGQVVIEVSDLLTISFPVMDTDKAQRRRRSSCMWSMTSSLCRLFHIHTKPT